MLQTTSEIPETRLPISVSWLDRWKRRRGILFRKRHGDSAGVDSSVVDQFLKTTVVDVFRRYNIEDIYNGDEWGMFWNSLPSYGPIKGNDKPIHGVKQSKDRFTAFCAVSMTGDVSPPLVIGKSEHPRALKGINDKDLPVIYLWNKSAWMTCFVFRTYLRAWNRRLKKDGRSIVLFVDNCSAHVLVESEDLTNIELVLYPANCTSVLQTMDAAIIKAIKSHYKHRLMSEYLDHLYDAIPYKANILSAINMLHESILELKLSTVVNSYKKTGFSYENAVNERTTFLQNRENGTAEGVAQRTSRPIPSSPNAAYEKVKDVLNKTQSVDPIQQLQVKFSSFQKKVGHVDVHNVNEYLDMDSKLQTKAGANLSDVVDQVKELFPEKFPVEEGVVAGVVDDDNAEVCSVGEAKLMLDRIYSFLLFSNSPPEAYACVNKLRRFCKQEAVKNSKQTTMLDFLKK